MALHQNDHGSVINPQKVIVLLLLILLLNFTNNVFCQSPLLKHRLITQPQKMAILDYKTKAVRSQWFVGDIGIIRVRENVEPDGTVSWRVSTLLDDSYKANPPREFVKVYGDIALIYPEESLPLTDVEKNLINVELDRVVLDRVYITPPKVNRQDTLTWGGLVSDKPVRGENGSLRIFQSGRRCLDNCDHAIGYLFKPGEEKFEVHETL